MKKQDSYEIDFKGIGKELKLEDVEIRDSFIPEGMITIFQKIHQEIEKKTEDEVVNNIYRFAINVDKEKVRKWLKRDAMLDHIEQSELIDIAVKKKFSEFQETIKRLRKRVEELENELIDANEQIDLLENNY